jgi:C-terminal processing protease CtpA/Prc
MVWFPEQLSLEDPMLKRLPLMLLLGSELFLGTTTPCQGQSREQKIEKRDRERAEVMLSEIHEALRKNYYDPKFHGLDIDERFRAYKEKIQKSETLGDAFRTVAAYLAGLDDSHTFFLPPRRSYHFDYGYQMRMVGDSCYITEIRSGSDSGSKLRLGDQVVSLDGYKVNRKDFWQLQYFLNQLAPKPVTEMTLRSPAGELRKEQIITRYDQGKHLKDLTFAGGLIDNYNLIFEEEKQRHVLRQRYHEQGEAMIWKMPIFDLDDDGVDHLMKMARKHKTLILDLRGNPGGYVATLERMIANVFDQDINLGKRITRKGEKPMVIRSRRKDAFSGNLIVLVDGASASAAELFARVIQLEHRGTVIGDRSSGSVMEARGYPFQIGTDVVIVYSASITSADLIMSDGKSLEKVGVTPDLTILPTAQEIARGLDPVLAHAAQLAGLNIDAAAAGRLFPFEFPPM